MRRRLALAGICASIAAIATCLAAAAPAGASSQQLMIMQDNDLTRSGSLASRARALDEMKALGADVVKVSVAWRYIATNGRPADPTNPNSYGRLGDIDAAVAMIVARGMIPFLSIDPPAPDFATFSRAGFDGTHRPSWRQYELFVTAVGRRYNGSFRGGSVPRVRMWSLLNEPNLDRHLYPQRNRNGVPLSPMIYRALYQAGRRGLAASGHANDTILFGELFPTTRSRFKVPPVEFMREVACLSSSYRPFRGNARKARKCPVSPAKLFASGIALHPYLPGTFVGGGGSLRGLRTPPRGRADVTIGYMHRMSRVIDKLNSKGRINGRLPLFVTEYGFQTKPPDIYATPIRTAARFMDESEWLAYRSARVKSYSHYQLVDQPLRNRRGPARYSLFQMGLRFPNGNKKPHVYPAFEMPFFVRLKRGGNLEIFGGVRAWPFSTVEVFQRSKARGARYHSLGTATLNSRGYFRIFRRISNSSGRYYRLKFTTPTGRVMRRTKTGVKR